MNAAAFCLAGLLCLAGLRGGLGLRWRPPSPTKIPRRRIAEALAALVVAAPPAVADSRARGAAELDFEYYLRALTTKNAPNYEGYVAYPPPRSIDAGVARKLIAAVDKAAFGVVERRSFSEESERQLASLAPEVRRRSRLGDSFTCEALENEYVFDAQLLARYSALDRQLPDLSRRADFAQHVSERTLAIYGVDAQDSRVVEEAGAAEKGLRKARQLLESMQGFGVFESYKLTGGDSCGKGGCTDEQVQEDWDDGYPVLLQLTTMRPFTLTRPLVVYLNRLGFDAKAEEYVMDSQYRPNVNEYRPDQLLVEIQLRRPPRQASGAS